MILARCPHCETIFRAEPEALKQRAGQVRCGKCREIFNALDHLLAEAPAQPPTPLPTFSLTPPPSPEDDPAPADLIRNETLAALPDDAPAAESQPDTTDGAALAVSPDDTPPEAADPLLDSTDEAAIAARETREASGYSKWAENTLSTPVAHFNEPRTGWLTVVSAVVLGLMLLIQSVYYWRTDIAQRWPDSRPWLEEACQSANCTVPYPRDASLINLEASELQIDPERGGMLVLHMTLKNRAAYPQAYPSIELTLTDTQDDVVVRRILTPEEWLPAPGDATLAGDPIQAGAFPAQREVATRLWIDALDTGAVGYQIFVFYP